MQDLMIPTKEILEMEKDDLEERIRYQLDLAEKYRDFHSFVYLEEDPAVLGPSLGVKDNISVKGKPLTSCSRILEGYIGTYDATAYSKLKSDTTFLGKTSCDPFGCGSSGATSDFGRTKHPLDPSRVPGGSSGGNGVALSLGIVDLALGTDTFGSARAPASFCGVVGMRPSYGLVSRYGLLDLSMSLDTIAPMARDVYGIAWLLERIYGKDEHDLTTVDIKLDFSQFPVDLKYPRIGVLTDCFRSPVDERISRLVEKTIPKLDVDIVEVEISTSLDLLVKAYYTIMPVEFASSMQRYSGFLYGKRGKGTHFQEIAIETRSDLLSPELKRRIILGTAISTRELRDKYYSRALSIFSKVREEVDKIFKDVDFLISPTMPVLPWRFDEIVDPVEIYMMDILTGIPPACGLPAISIPVGSVEGFPVGMQIIGPRFGDVDVLRLARMYEEGIA